MIKTDSSCNLGYHAELSNDVNQVIVLKKEVFRVHSNKMNCIDYREFLFT
jgi:hypothetical protein